MVQQAPDVEHVERSGSVAIWVANERPRDKIKGILAAAEHTVIMVTAICGNGCCASATTNPLAWSSTGSPPTVSCRSIQSALLPSPRLRPDSQQVNRL
jgi:hypothetical protein